MKGMLFFLFVPIFLFASCSGNAYFGTNTADISDSQSTIHQDYPVETGTASLSLETTSSDCPGEDAEKIGRSIADPYAFTTTEEVMDWFCQGAEFEDILVALETEEHTGTAAEDMLVMRAEGLSWEEIWLVVGFTE